MITALRTLLLQSPDVTSVVGLDGVYWLRAPQERRPPYITLQLIDDQPNATHTGADTLTQSTVQINCVGGVGGLGAKRAIYLAKAVRDKLHGFEGTVATPDQPYNFHGIFQRAGRDMPFDPRAGEEEPIFAISVDYDVSHSMATTVTAAKALPGIPTGTHL